MDALVYEDTPLATYFEGEAVPYDLPREQTPSDAPFAPCGLPDLKDHLRTIRRRATGIANCPTPTEQLLERFHYLVVASQLLADDGGIRLTPPENDISEIDTTTLGGAAVTAVASFLAAWVLHWIRTRKRTLKAWSWIDVGSYSLGFVLFALVATHLGRWQYTHYLQKSSVRTLSKLVDDSRNFDSTATNAVRFIQEVEVVARGYELSYPLPPVSRLEDRQVIRRCHTLRRELAAALKMLTIAMVDSHNAIQNFVNDVDVQRYHDIYEVSLVEYSQAIEVANRSSIDEPQTSLKELRFSLQLYTLARKVFLCDLLALRRTRGWIRFHQWKQTLQILFKAEAETMAKQSSLSTLLAEEEFGSGEPGDKLVDDCLQNDRDAALHDTPLKKQMRRFDDVANSVRALNAKVHLVREEIGGLKNSNTDNIVVASALSRHYESLGSELKMILSEWEHGKNIMLLNTDQDFERVSCASSSVRTPPSPASSVGGIQIIDGGPADALRLLTGDSPSTQHTNGIFEEEVFEAVAERLPRKRMSVSGGMTRGEKIAKLQEERKKRATLYEQTANTTNMLRELQMVIKHRPKGSQPANRVASL